MTDGSGAVGRRTPTDRRGAVWNAANRWRALIFGAAVLLYLPTVGHDFVFDDDIAIVRNTSIRSLANLPAIFSTTEWGAGGGPENHLYRPLTTLTYAINHQISGLQPWSYHAFNVLIHGIVALLVFGLALNWRLPVAAAGFAGLVFALHPIHVEAVANVVGRRDLLAAGFTLALLLAHSRARLQRGPLLWPVLAYAAAMFSKETGVVGIGLVLLHDWLVPPEAEGRSEWRRNGTRLYAVYGVALLGYLLIRWSVTGGFGVALIPFIDNPLAHVGSAERWLTAVALFGKGLALQLLPFSQSPDYSYNAIPLVEHPLDLRFVLAAASIVCAAGFAFTWRRRTPLLLLGLGLYVLPLLPAANLLFPVGTVFGERLLYLPSVAVALAAGWALSALLHRVPRRLGVPALASVLLLLAFGTTLYTRAWRDELSLFTRAVRSVPASTKAHTNLADALLRADRTEEALAEGRRAVEIWPDNFRALALTGEAWQKLGRYDEAERSLGRALEIEPGYADALYVLGQVRRDQGDLAEAGRLWLRALDSMPNHPGALADLGTLALVNDNLELARAYSEAAVSANPLQANAWYNLGLIHERTGDPVRAREAFRQFVGTAGPEYDLERASIRARLQGDATDRGIFPRR